VKRVYARGDERRELAPDPALAPIVAKWRFDRACAALERQGFARVAGDEPAPPSHDELLAAIRATPDLPRRTPATRRDELERAETRLLFENAARLWGALGETIVDVHAQRYACDLIDATWQCGFLRGVAIRELGDAPERLATLIDALATLEIAIPLRSIALASNRWRVRSLAPLLRHTWPLLAELAIETYSSLQEHAFDASAICIALAAGSITPRLRKLTLRRGWFTRASLDALEALRLEELVLYGVGIPEGTQQRLEHVAARVRVVHAEHHLDVDD
jgi:hypothetical protein